MMRRPLCVKRLSNDQKKKKNWINQGGTLGKVKGGNADCCSGI
ncbi:MAG: hypothetical protein ACTSRZ_20750 [Promethearchaeota archaeon]